MKSQRRKRNFTAGETARKGKRGIMSLGRIAGAMIMRACWLLLFVLAQAQAEPKFDVAATKDVMVPMRDGVRLATDIYRPARDGVAAAGKFPVVMERTPYDKANGTWL